MFRLVTGTRKQKTAKHIGKVATTRKKIGSDKTKFVYIYSSGFGRMFRYEKVN